jgi:hypothetical protein
MWIAISIIAAWFLIFLVTLIRSIRQQPDQRTGMGHCANTPKARTCPPPAMSVREFRWRSPALLPMLRSDIHTLVTR